MGSNPAVRRNQVSLSRPKKTFGFGTVPVRLNANIRKCKLIIYAEIKNTMTLFKVRYRNVSKRLVQKERHNEKDTCFCLLKQYMSKAL